MSVYGTGLHRPDSVMISWLLWLVHSLKGAPEIECCKQD